STPTPTATPTPTPDPAEQLSDAARVMHDGDYGTAAEIYRDLLTLPLDEEVSAQSQLDLGAAYLRDGEYVAAITTLHAFLDLYPQSEQIPQARFLLAESLVGAGEPLSATEEYRAYLSSGTVITSYLNEWLGDALYAGGEYLAASEAYLAAIAQVPDLSTEVGLRERLALVYVALGEYGAAVAQYDGILAVAQIPNYRARIEHQAAETLLLAGETEAGYERHLTVVERYYADYSPYAEYYPYLSLVKLVEAGRPPGDLLRGIVDYYGRAYGPAVEALYRYINADPDHSGDAHWFAGLSFLRAGSPNLAINEFQVLIDTHPENRHWGDGWMGLAEAYSNAGDLEAAGETYREFVAAAPDHARAPEALWEAAWLLEQNGELRAAAEAYMDCHVHYPAADRSAEALFRSGLQSYRLDDLSAAAVAWETLTALYPDSPHRPAAFLWLGKLRRRQEDDEAARTAFEEAAAAAPSSYYGLRAADLAADPDAPPFPPVRYTTAHDEAAGRAEAEAWLAGWLGLEEAAGLGELVTSLAADSRLRRGLELWRLGRFQEAKGELEAVRIATRSDALAQYQLALLFRDIGLYRSSILCAARLVSLSPEGDYLKVPPFVARLTHPTYYEELVLENGRQSGLDPLLVFALIRQESLFESLAASSASARGLMQVIPPTGAEIQAALNWPPDYQTADLYRPYVSLRFGTYYLAQQRDRFDDRIEVALAAYNGGPFRAARWVEAAGADPDMFLELITLSEPRLYIQRIKEHLAVYHALYGD
ncbi:MAG TPA: outer membrane protein assembly factor BamD, partial [Chloroflexi bacterium]|nr:outer membrane protein assembly factor BamD [Chloroflexota bacterium]